LSGFIKQQGSEVAIVYMQTVILFSRPLGLLKFEAVQNLHPEQHQFQECIVLWNKHHQKRNTFECVMERCKQPLATELTRNKKKLTNEFPKSTISRRHVHQHHLPDI
jgi:hypothetical protein